MTITSASPLDAKVVRQLETAVSKSSFVGQGKKLKVVPKVCTLAWKMRGCCIGRLMDIALLTLRATGQP
jgi:hypothetical protein